MQSSYSGECNSPGRVSVMQTPPSRDGAGSLVSPYRGKAVNMGRVGSGHLKSPPSGSILMTPNSSSTMTPPQAGPGRSGMTPSPLKRRTSSGLLYTYGRKIRSPMVVMLFLLTLGIGGVGVLMSARNTSWMVTRDAERDIVVQQRYTLEENALREMEASERQLLESLPPWNEKRSCSALQDGDKNAGGSSGESIPNLIPVHTWSSQKEMNDEPSISIVTHLSADRLPNLEDQCISWPDRIVAAVYVPFTANASGGLPLLPSYSSTTLDDMIRGIDAFHRFMEGTALCALDIIFLGQFIDVTEFPGPYPTNALRNRAMSLVRTPLSIHINTDFIVNPVLGTPGKGYKDPQSYQTILNMAKKKIAYLLPQLEPSNHGQDLKVDRNVARHFAMTGKNVAKAALEKKILQPYQSPDDEGVEDAFMIDIKKWLQTDTHFQVKEAVNPYSEPCVLLATELAPWFDERFVDNGSGASLWLAQLRQLKFKFKVHAGAYVVHIPHERAPHSSRYLHNRHEFRLEVMKFLNSSLAKEIDENKYKPLTRQCGSEWSLSKKNYTTV